MINELRVVLTSKDRLNLKILFIILLISTTVEMVGIGSIPVFAILVTDPSQISKYIHFDIGQGSLLELEKKKIVTIFSFILLFIFIIKNLFLIFVNYFQAYTVKCLKENIYHKLFNNYINSEYEFFLIKNPSELIRNITSEVGRSSNYILNIIMLVKEVLIAATIFILLLYVDFKITILIFSLLGIFSAFFYLITKKETKKRGEITQYVWGTMLKAVNQGLGSAKETKILNKEKYITDIFDENIKEIEKYNLQQSFIIGLPRIFLEVIAIFTITIVSILFFYFGRSPGDFIPLLSLIVICSLRLMPSFNTITSSFSRLKFYYPAFKLVYEEFRDLSKEKKLFVKDNTNNNYKDDIVFSKKIELNNIDFFYPNQEKKIINNVTLSISFGEVVGVVGESGAGKSTLVDLIIGLLDPSKGSILIDDKDIKMTKKQWQKQIGYIPQESYLFDDTIKSNIAFGVKENDIDANKIKQSIKLAELDKFINTLPQRENTVIGDRGIRLSGGQKQRIGIARSLYNEPKILIFDEPTSSLDIENEKKIMDHIFSLGKNMTIIIISHRLSILKDCDKIIKIENGKIKEIIDYNYLSKN